MTNEELIESVLLYLEYAKPCSKIRNKFHDFSLKEFANAEFLHDFSTEDLGILTDVRPNELDGPLNIAIFSSYNQQNERHGGSYFTFHRFKKISPKQARGRVYQIYPYMVEWLGATIIEKGYVGSKTYLAYCDEEWKDIGVYCDKINGTYRSIRTKKDLFLPTLACGVQFTRRYQWLAIVGLDNGPTISLPTDPTGCRELFRLRDVPAGKQRRTALKNWISEHWRMRRSNPLDEIKVREHLRGATKFNWNGLFVEIKPSQFDLDRNEEIKGKQK